MKELLWVQIEKLNIGRAVTVICTTFLVFSLGCAYKIVKNDLEIRQYEKEYEQAYKEALIESAKATADMQAQLDRLDAQASEIRKRLEQEYNAEKITEVKEDVQTNIVEKEIIENKIVEAQYNENDIQKIRCTTYCDVGYTASGAWTTNGVLAGKRDWLNKEVVLYRVNADGTIGEKIGDFVFKDTGAGIDTDGDGKGDTIINGKSIDVWCDGIDACWEWIREYGDYVFMEIKDNGKQG